MLSLWTIVGGRVDETRIALSYFCDVFSSVDAVHDGSVGVEKDECGHCSYIVLRELTCINTYFESDSLHRKEKSHTFLLAPSAASASTL